VAVAKKNAKVREKKARKIGIAARD